MTFEFVIFFGGGSERVPMPNVKKTQSESATGK